MDLIIVESPTKARALRGFLGRDYRVVASMGHIRDLPPKELGVDVAHNFRPTYRLRKGGRKVLKQLRESLVGDFGWRPGLRVRFWQRASRTAWILDEIGEVHRVYVDRDTKKLARVALENMLSFS